MNILYIAHGGFGDVSFTTQWPEIWTSQGHIVDVFLMRYTGNPFHRNPFVRNTFIFSCLESVEGIVGVLKKHSYDKIFTYENTNMDLKGVIEVIRPLKESFIVSPKKCSVQESYQGSDIVLPQLSPKYYFEDRELQYCKDRGLENAYLFFPLSSSHDENSRNIGFSLIKSCVHAGLSDVVIAHSGREFDISLKGLDKVWEGHNAFDDEQGTVLGKILALTSLCKVGIHGWSGSILMSIGFDKPFVVIVPRETLRNNANAPFMNTRDQYEILIRKITRIGYKNSHAWCITDKCEDVLKAIEMVLSGRSGFFNGTWEFF